MKKYLDFINEEVGLRNISKISKKYKKAEIYLHKDLDGVTTALAIKEFLKNYYQIETVDCHIIQYGGLEFAVNNTKEGNLSVLVDFAHGKPMFQLQFDHHDSQVGDGDTDSTYFKTARSNAEIISGEISYNEIFTQKDIDIIRTVDSADFLNKGIKPEDVQNSIFKYQKAETPEKNRFLMGLVVNRLLLAYKNKRLTVRSLDGKRTHKNKNILECLTLDSNPSLYSMFNNIRHYINNAKTNDKLGRLATEEEIYNNLQNYIRRMKNYSFVEDEKGDVSEATKNEIKVLKIINGKSEKQLDDVANSLGTTLPTLKQIIKDLIDKKYLFFNKMNKRYSVGNFGRKIIKNGKVMKGVHFDEKYKIIIQYAGGNMFMPGSYDRYTPFKNYPDAEFICMVWPMGLIQVSCNPFKEKSLKGIDLGQISSEVLANHKKLLNNFYISLESLKYEFETSQDWKKMSKEEQNYQGVGFKFSDLEAFYKDYIYKNNTNIDINGDKMLKDCMNTLYENMTMEQKSYLKEHKIPVWEIIRGNSGGHKSITNVTGFNFLTYNKEALYKFFNSKSYIDVLKKMGRELVNKLKEKIDMSRSGNKITYDTDVDLKGTISNENKIVKFKNFKL